MKPQLYIQKTLEKALHSLGIDRIDPTWLNLDKPKQEGFGDLAITAAMALARELRQPPRKIAQDLIDRLELDPFYVEKTEIAGPGFINLFLAKTCLRRTVIDILEEGEAFGNSDWGQGNRVQFEFVSANPTGPLNIVSARAAAIGDVLATLHERVGFKVEREYYVNDAGRQVRLLGASVNARYMAELGHKTEIPEGGYHGAYLIDLARDIVAMHGHALAELSEKERLTRLGRMALDTLLAGQRASMDKYRLSYDRWFRETDLRQRQAHLQVLQIFAEKELTFEKDGATWFRSSLFGDEKDRVLVTSEGEPTYFLIDIAYHLDKYERGFAILYDLWGPDHHGYIERMRAAIQALGYSTDSFRVHIIQQVNLFRSGEVVKMSKRAGEIIEMDELIDEVGVDAARYFFVDRRISQPLDFDIDLAKKQSDENPVYYIQYAHARISNILRYAEEQGVAPSAEADLSALENDSEMDLIKKCLDFGQVISKAAQFVEPHRVTTYLYELANVFHRFYHDNRVVSEDHRTTQARLILIRATRQVIKNGLTLLRIDAPENM
ncbi:arginine--tRNA ligase [candidate division KSB1 bacterium]|nr:arginine--tRNA ligase [candidate division KSB1 bacterium]